MIELNQREKLWILLALVVFIPLLAVRFVLQPIQEYQKNQSDRILNMEEKIDQINLFGQELMYLKRENKTRSVSLNKKIDGMLRQLRLKPRSRTIVEENPDGGQRLILKLDEVNLTELANIIYKIENAKPGIIIENIEINPSYQNKKLFRVSSALSSQ